jgi:hypothetical protein
MGCLEESKPDFVVRLGIALFTAFFELAGQLGAVALAARIR